MGNFRTKIGFAWRFSLLFALSLVSVSSANAFDSSAHRPIVNIVVDGPQNPGHYGLAVGNLSRALALGAAVGPGATAGELGGSRSASARANNLTDALAQQHLLLGDEMNEAMRGALVQSGYNVIIGTTSGVADARLEISIDESTYERRVWGKVGPHLIVSVHLIDEASKHSLFSRTYSYDMYARTFTYTILRPADEFGFDRPEDVLMHSDIAAAGFRAAIPMIVADVCSSLKGI